jgi:hypothetical protein
VRSGRDAGPMKPAGWRVDAVVRQNTSQLRQKSLNLSGASSV